MSPTNKSVQKTSKRAEAAKMPVAKYTGQLLISQTASSGTSLHTGLLANDGPFTSGTSHGQGLIKDFGKYQINMENKSGIYEKYSNSKNYIALHIYFTCFAFLGAFHIFSHFQTYLVIVISCFHGNRRVIAVHTRASCNAPC